MPLTAAAALDDVSDDAFLGDALRVLQPRRGYRAGLDAVLLAASLVGLENANVLDVGSGVGVVALCLAHHMPALTVTLVERDPGLADLARKNVERNGMSDRLSVIEADVTQALANSPALHARAESFDVVVSNPPFHDELAGTAAPNPLKAVAHAMPAGNLERWLQFMASMARPSGAMHLIHRADALDEILAACGRRFGHVAVRPIHPRADAQASRVIVTGTKGSRAPPRILPGLVLHAEDGGFQEPIEAVLRRGAALPGA